MEVNTNIQNSLLQNFELSVIESRKDRQTVGGTNRRKCA